MKCKNAMTLNKPKRSLKFKKKSTVNIDVNRCRLSGG